MKSKIKKLNEGKKYYRLVKRNRELRNFMTKVVSLKLAALINSSR